MELRSCSYTHFIQAIRGGLVMKVQNTDSKGRPNILYKTLKDVYDDKYTKELHQFSTGSNMDAGSVSDYEQVKRETPCFPMVDRRLWEVKLEADEFVPHSDDGGDSDPDDDTTLKQLKERSQRKKRKFIFDGENSNQAHASKKPVEDESDLNEPLINWKSKKSSAKRKNMTPGVASSSAIGFAIKSEQDLVSEVSHQLGGEFAVPSIQVKVEVAEAEELGFQSNQSFGDDASIGPGEVSIRHEEPMQPLWCAEGYQKCDTNEVSYDHLEDAEPISVLVPSEGTCVNSKIMELCGGVLMDLSPVATGKGEEISNIHPCRSSPSESPSISEEMSNGRSNSCIQIPDIANDDSTGGRRLLEFNNVMCNDKDKAYTSPEQDNFMSTPENNSSSSMVPITSLKVDGYILSKDYTSADDEQPSACTSDDISKNGMNRRSNMEDDLLKTEDKQASSLTTDVEIQSSTNAETFDSADRTPERCLLPERLPSTRKAISPSSREQLCLAMNSFTHCNDFDQYTNSECKGKIFKKQTGQKVSPGKSDNQHAKITVHHGGRGQISLRKVIINPRDIKKAQNVIRNLEGPRLCRTVPNLSTGCMSIQGCSESAIAFSQRQIHDMESLALKLMDELKSMKDMVETKLLFEAYRNASLKNDADEVKAAISSATKMEEMARKWLSMMARDCNRFCKIMKLTPNDLATSKDAVPSKKKKIVFADEAGKKLCHVNFFEDGASSPESGGLKQ